jgi:hypothetical protein
MRGVRTIQRRHIGHGLALRIFTKYMRHTQVATHFAVVIGIGSRPRVLYLRR